MVQQAALLKMPALLLQGARDAFVSPTGAQAVNAALGAHGNPDHTLNVYPDLGHSLGPATSTADDHMRPMSPRPLADLAHWLTTHR